MDKAVRPACREERKKKSFYLPLHSAGRVGALLRRMLETSGDPGVDVTQMAWGPWDMKVPSTGAALWGICASGNRERVARPSTLRKIGKHRKENNLPTLNTQISVSISILMCSLWCKLVVGFKVVGWGPHIYLESPFIVNYCGVLGDASLLCVFRMHVFL